MENGEWVQCPDCGWTGRTAELTSSNKHCPSCNAAVAIE